MEHKPKLVAFDLDGTLAESKSPVSPQMGALLAQLLQKMPVAIMSGAAFAQYSTQFFPAFPADANFANLHIFPDNAAQCYEYANGAWQARYDLHFTPAERQQIMSALTSAIAQTNINTLVPQTWGPQVEDRGAQITFSALGQQAPVEAKKQWDPTREKRKPLYDLLVQELPGFSIGLNAATSIDITRKDITKAYGVRQLSEITGINIGDMLYVGDALEERGNDAVVKETGIPTRQVTDPAATAELITELLQ